MVPSAAEGGREGGIGWREEGCVGWGGGGGAWATRHCDAQGQRGQEQESATPPKLQERLGCFQINPDRDRIRVLTGEGGGWRGGTASGKDDTALHHPS